MRLGLVVPVFDEVARLEEHVPQLLQFVGGLDRGSEIVFVDDGSRDGTPDALDRIICAAHATHARVLRREHEGKGAAVSAGLDACRHDLLAFCDLDLSTPLSDLARVLDVASRGDLLAIGSRDLSSSIILNPESRGREFLGRMYNRLLQATVTPGIVDTQCGAKAARAGVWARLLPHCRQLGYAWDAELVAVALALDITVQEIPVTWSHDRRSRVHVLRDGLDMVRQTPTIWRSARRASAADRAVADSITRDSTPIARRDEVFDDVTADHMQAVDRRHWWFRSKAAYVATALARTRGTSTSPGWLVDAGGGSGAVATMVGWPADRVAIVEGNRSLTVTARNASGLGAVQGSVHHLPVADRSVEVLTLLDVIEHLADPQAALAEGRRVLRPGGRMVINVPAHQWLWSEADVRLGHHRRYRRRDLRATLVQAGFEPELITHIFSWLVLPVWILRRTARPGQPELGLDRHSPLIDRAALVLTALERPLIARLSLPIGTSVLAVARATGG